MDYTWAGNYEAYLRGGENRVLENTIKVKRQREGARSNNLHLGGQLDILLNGVRISNNIFSGLLA